MDYAPIPQRPLDIMVALEDLENLQRTLMKTRAMLRRGMIEQTENGLEEAVRSVRRIKGDNNFDR